jgi:dipeptidyl aminopeptidase/acylaminoacyl peptidase
MNHASEIFISFEEKHLETTSNVNTATYSSLTLSKTERRYVTTTDGKKMLVWVVLPPNFDPKKISNTFILSRWTTIAIDAILLLPMEFTADGC